MAIVAETRGVESRAKKNKKNNEVEWERVMSPYSRKFHTTFLFLSPSSFPSPTQTNPKVRLHSYCEGDSSPSWFDSGDEKGEEVVGEKRDGEREKEGTSWFLKILQKKKKKKKKKRKKTHRSIVKSDYNHGNIPP